MDNPIVKSDAELRYCESCKLFLSLKMFKPGGRRLLCRKHYNMEMYELKKKSWVEDPQKRQSFCIWQVAYVDSKKTFQRKVEISIHEVSELLKIHKIDACQTMRLTPVDPEKAISFHNCLLVPKDIKTELCYIWKHWHCKKRYTELLNTYGQSPTCPGPGNVPGPL